MVIKKGDKVKVKYTGKLDDEGVFDKTEDGKPLEFTVGNEEIISGFDKAVEGMKLNEEKTVTVKPEEAYGNRNNDLIEEFPKDSLPQDVEPQKGAILALKTQSGQTLPVTIVDITESNVILDLNHPLAGKRLTFDIKVVSVNPP